MKGNKLIIMSLVILLSACNGTMQYKDVDQKTAAKIIVLNTEKLTGAVVCQPGRRGEISGFQELAIDAGVPTYIYITGVTSYYRTRACYMSAYFEPQVGQTYNLMIHNYESKCYLSISKRMMGPFVKKEADLRLVYLHKSDKNHSCEDAMENKKTARNIDPQIEIADLIAKTAFFDKKVQVNEERRAQ